MNPSSTRRQLLSAVSRCALGALSAATPWSLARAQGTSPLRVILPLGPGSGVDGMVRAAQPALSRALGGQPVVIENLPGAGGITGTQALVRAAPDGQTIAFVSNNHSVNPSVYRKLPYDSLADITPISVVGSSPFVLLVNPNKVPARTARELQAFFKARPGGCNYGSSGNGTIIHLAGEMFVDAADVQVTHVPYKGMGPMLTDVMGGQIEMGVASVSAVLGQIRSGALRPIGVMGRQRVASLPDVPTFAEQGFPDIDVSGWFAAIGPRGLPPEQLRRLNEAVTTAFNDADVKAALSRQDNLIAPGTPEQAARFFRSEQERFARLVKKAGITLE